MAGRDGAPRADPRSFEGLWRGASTVLLGRTNYEGFQGYWPAVARDPDADPRDRAFATWLDDVEKVVFSRTLTEATWANSRLASDLEGEVRALTRAPGRDIVVLSSVSIIQGLLRTGLLDELRTYLVPAVLGGGPRLFPEGLPPSRWELTSLTTIPTGALILQHRRQ